MNSPMTINIESMKTTLKSNGREPVFFMDIDRAINNVSKSIYMRYCNQEIKLGLHVVEKHTYGI